MIHVIATIRFPKAQDLVHHHDHLNQVFHVKIQGVFTTLEENQ